MYESEEAARKALDDAFEDETAAALAAKLRPVIGFRLVAADKGEPALGATRIGGTPDLGRDLEWPIRKVPDNLDEIVGRGGSNHGEHIREHLARPLPYEFLAQVDLAEAARLHWPGLGEVAADLPSEGRLLFFYDGMTGPWNTATSTCRVVWDKSAIGDVTRREMPEVFKELGEKFIDEILASMTEWSKTQKMPAPKREDYKSPYWGPARAMELKAMLQLPDRFTLETQADKALDALLEDDDVADALGEIRDGFRVTTHLENQLLGLPRAEQDDPRYDAVVVSDYGVQHLERTRWQAEFPKVRAAAADWRLLAQFSLRDYSQDRLTEGYVYFLIRREDLAARRFDAVVADYQQT